MLLEVGSKGNVIAWIALVALDGWTNRRTTSSYSTLFLGGSEAGELPYANMTATPGIVCGDD